MAIDYSNLIGNPTLAATLRYIQDGLRAPLQDSGDLIHTLPQTSHSHIFQVTGGNVRIRRIFGVVTTAIQNQANSTKLTSYPTSGASIDLCTGTSVAALALNSLLSIPAGVGNALIVGAAGGVQAPTVDLLIPPGYIDVACAAGNTGAWYWVCYWVPEDVGAGAQLVAV